MQSLVFSCICLFVQYLVFHRIPNQLPNSFRTCILGSGVFCHVLCLFTRLCIWHVGINVLWNWESKLGMNLYHCGHIFYLLLWYVFISANILVCSFLISVAYFYQLKFNDSGTTRAFLPHYGLWNMRCKVCMHPVMHKLDNFVYSQSKLFLLQ